MLAANCLYNVEPGVKSFMKPTLKILASCVLFALCLDVLADDDVELPTQRLELREWFGVDHPLQIVEFALNAPAPREAGVLMDEVEKPAYDYGSQRISDPGAGHLSVTMSLLSGQPSLLLEEETDLDEAWAMNLYEGVAPDQARYCGHHASAPQFGRMADGKVYPASHERPIMDALVDLQYDHSQMPIPGNFQGGLATLLTWWLKL